MNNSRTILVVISIFVLFTILIVRLFDIQILRNEELKYYAQRQQTTLEKIKAERGLLYDRNGVLLAYNRNDVSFYVDLRMATKDDKKKIAEKFSSVFSKTVKYYKNIMNNTGKTICIEKKAPSEKALILKNLKINGLFSEEDPTRVYHYGTLASHVLGYVNTNFKGVNGAAKSFNDVLTGVDGDRLVERNAIGDMISVSEEETKPAEAGYNIFLTINKSYQAILEEELKAGIAAFGGSSAVGIIMDPNNGDILALSNIKDYDPNKYWEYSDEDRRDRALTDTYEPGSTFKSITMAALLDQNLCKEDEVIDVENGKYKYKNVNITDTHKNQFLTVKKIIEESSNVGISKLVQRIDDELLFKYIRGFGFGNYTSIKLPGESKGMLKKPTEWNQLTKTFMSFGYEVSVTPIQMITAYCALVNGGVLYEPQILKEEVKHDGTVVLDNSPREVRRVISEKTSAKMREFLKGVVENGTGKNAQIKNISVGGKTGTSQKLIDGNYSKAEYNSSFIGFFPVEKPQFVCLVLVNSPTIGRYGGAVAAPIFQKVAQRIININPSLFNFPYQNNEHKQQEIKAVYVNDLSPVKERTSYVKNLSTSEIKNISRSNVMPNLSNYSLRDGIMVLNKLGMKYKVKGSGKIVSQSINPGESIRKGLLCTLECEEVTVKGTVVY